MVYDSVITCQVISAMCSKIVTDSVYSPYSLLIVSLKYYIVIDIITHYVIDTINHYTCILYTDS
jgi:hypothetical protein